jgi:hypothetical protein
MLNYGKSDKPADADVSLAAQSRLMVKVLDALGIPRADMVAHIIGGVAQLTTPMTFQPQPFRSMPTICTSLREARRKTRTDRCVSASWIRTMK